MSFATSTQAPQTPTSDLFISPEVLMDEPPEGVRELRPLTQDEVKTVVSGEIQDSLGTLGSEIAEQRRKAIRYYYGRPFGNEQEGRSQVVLTDVADTIEWILPDLIRMFVSSGRIWRFKPRKPGDEEAANQATDVVNHVFLDQADGFRVLHDWFKDALLEKNGIVKPVYEERYEPKISTYRGITEAELYLILSDDSTDIIGLEERPDESIVDIQSGQPMALYDVQTRQIDSRCEFKVYGVPPEEFLIARRAVKLDDTTPFSAHRMKVTVSDLVAMGYPLELVGNLPSDDSPEFSQGRTERLSADETYPRSLAERSDPASRELWLTDCYVRIDEDGDGYSELRNILVVGEQSVTVLDDYHCNGVPFCSLTPIPMPHKFFGLSIADLTMDLQLIRSHLLRQMMDNVYFTNNSRYAVVEGMAEYDDLLTSRPGGIVRVAQQGMVEPLETRPLPDSAMQMMEFLDGVRETRTGVSRWQQGPEAASMKHQTLGAVSQVRDMAGARIELIGRIFGETGVKDLGKKLLRLIVENASRELTVRLRGKWVTVDPRAWAADMDVEVEVGLGQGEQVQRMSHLQQIADRQAQALQGGLGGLLVTPRNLYNVACDMTETMGFRHVDERYFMDPGDQPFPQPQPSVEDQVKVAETERRSRENAAKAESDAVKLALEADRDEKLQTFRMADLRQKATLERERLDVQERIAEMQVRAQLRAALEADSGRSNREAA